MRKYLQFINPIISVIVFLLCLYAALFDGGFKPENILKGGFATYFAAKGLFCSSALFIFGRILLILMPKTEDKKDKHAGS